MLDVSEVQGQGEWGSPMGRGGTRPYQIQGQGASSSRGPEDRDPRTSSLNLRAAQRAFPPGPARGRILQVPPACYLRNPKSEARNSKEIRSPKPERLLASETACPPFHPFLRTSDFGLPSGFGPRISGFRGDGVGGDRPDAPPARAIRPYRHHKANGHGVRMVYGWVHRRGVQTVYRWCNEATQ